jgi:peptide/nickel transport system ATP-binding protein
MSGKLVEAEGLAIAFADPSGRAGRALDSVTFDLAPGEALGVVGESGSGKSTLARALLGHLRAGARLVGGTLRVGGQEPLALRGAALLEFRRRRIGFVPQGALAALTPHRRVGAQVEEALRARGMPAGAARAQALVLMAEAGLAAPGHLAARYPHELSGGQRQRVVIAAALAGEPELLVLDEPTTALDRATEAQILALLRDLRARRGLALLHVSHDLNVIGALADRVVVMRAGRIEEAAPTATLFAGPRSAYARSLLAAVPRIVPRPPAPPAPPLLEIDALRFCYPRQPGFALGPLSLTLGEGRTLGVVGASGSGKSTLAALIAGLASGHEGRMKLGGQVIGGVARDRPVALRRRIQLVFQDPLASLNPRHSVETIVTRPLRLFAGLDRAAARQRAARLLAEMEIDAALLDRRPQELSGGQQQRVAIARALAAEPVLLLCDEVTSALDVTTQAQVLALLQAWQRRSGAALMVISHDLGVVSRLADDVLVLQDGQARDQGTAMEVLERPRHSYTTNLLATWRGMEWRAPATAAAD